MARNSMIYTKLTAETGGCEFEIQKGECRARQGSPLGTKEEHPKLEVAVQTISVRIGQLWEG